MSRPFLDASLRHPIILPDGSPHTGTVRLNQVIDHPKITVGDYSYYSGFDTPADYASALAPYLYPGAPERLTIGKFCQIAHGVRIITSSANHAMDGFSTYPFAVFNPDLIGSHAASIGNRRDTVVGNDVWLGFESVVTLGVHIGNGAIIPTRSVVTSDVPDYAVVGGNPGRAIRQRFPDNVVQRLLTLAWWDWGVEQIGCHVDAITGADIEVLERVG